ncbi:hypothetical protein GHT06_019806 [Daphnia sinensis]|uniref:Uncharacterized protein n=1 Tax=Daphnia sinensis TaxID=1820382 RepID=A0AAD5PQY4_9CRUS|nr:hypothetical protein GHT06_019806 [Daphnia sinensis]
MSGEGEFISFAGMRPAATAAAAAAAAAEPGIPTANCPPAPVTTGIPAASTADKPPK